jgi:type II secretory pathway pseudopilin PulG
LLTVIAIIGILAGILIPVVGRMRNSARNATCISNLRQFGAAFYLYAQEHKDLLPAGGNSPVWFSDLRPYLSSISNSPGELRLRCPSFSVVFSQYFPNDDPNKKFTVGYQYNRNLGDAFKLPLSRIQNPSLTPMIWDSPGAHTDQSSWPGPPPSPGGPERKYRHSGKINLLMVSGSIQNRKGVFNPDEKVTDTDLPFEQGGINWEANGQPWYWERSN